jgi:Uncharacterized protein conserved in bacteria
MIDEANKSARAAAQKFASDSDSKLGKIKTATQGQFSIADRDEIRRISESPRRNQRSVFLED